MKKINIIYTLIISALIFSCSLDDEKVVDENFGVLPVVTDIVNGFFDLADTANASSGFTLSTSDAGGAVSSSGEIMVNFNGGEYSKIADVSSFPVTVNYSLAEVASLLGVNVGDLALGDAFQFKFYITTTTGERMTSATVVDVPMSCVSDLAGAYSVTTTYGYHDFLPDYSSNTMNIDVVQVSDGVYSVFDFSGGLYSSGPYSSAYGTGDSSFTVTFRDTCNNISWTGQSDPWGACIPADGGTNSVDSSTGVITISWYCEGYGENGVSVYTPID